MKYILFFCICISGCTGLEAQMVGSDIFLKGNYVEVGMNDRGALGSSSSAPAGYNPYPSGQLAIVYDYGHDGWTAGSPAYFGDYILPITDFEGWGIQMNGISAWAIDSGASYIGSGLSGHNVSYSSSGTSVTGYWQGSFEQGTEGLAIKMQTKIDLDASWITVTVSLYNTTTTAATGIYYVRACNPQNNEARSGLSLTDNIVNFQTAVPGSDSAMVSATDTISANAFLALAAINNQTRAFSIPGSPMGYDLSSIWSGTISPADYTAGRHYDGDYNIGLIFNIGTILAGDSVSFSYAYILSGVNAIDSAFRDMGPTTTAINNISTATNVQLIPNPAKNRITFIATDPMNDLCIFNILGECVYSCKDCGKRKDVDLSGIPQGIYYARINGGETKRFIKQ